MKTCHLQSTESLTRHRARPQSPRISSASHVCRRKLKLRLVERPRWRSCRASADTNRSQQPQPVARRPTADGLESSQLGASPSASTGAAAAAAPPAVNPKLVSIAKLLLGGAVAAAVLASGYEFGSHLLSSLESVPALAHLELLLGTAVTARTLAVYLSDRDARTAVDQKVVAAVVEVKEAIGLDELAAARPAVASSAAMMEQAEEILSPAVAAIMASPPLPLGPGTEPTMLEVEIRSIVDSAVSSAMGGMDMGMDGPVGMGMGVGNSMTSSVTVDRRALIESMTEYIRQREQHARLGQEILLEELEASEAIRQSLVQLQKSKEARRARREAEGAAMQRLQQLQVDSLWLQDAAPLVESEDIQQSLSSLSLSTQPAPQPDIQPLSCSGLPPAAAESSAPATSVEISDPELESAQERARKFREKLDAMKRAKQRRQENQLSSEQGDGGNVQ